MRESKYLFRNHHTFGLSFEQIDEGTISLYLGDSKTDIQEVPIEDLIGFTTRSIADNSVIPNPYSSKSNLVVRQFDETAGRAIVELVHAK